MRYTAGMTKEQFVADERTYDAVMRNLEVTGEAARHVPGDLRNRHVDVEWRKIAGFRDIAIHACATIDDDIVWDIVQHKMPQLAAQIQRILAAEFSGPPQ
jgi:uncharacterized protein with HEPN domain